MAARRRTSGDHEYHCYAQGSAGLSRHWRMPRHSLVDDAANPVGAQLSSARCPISRACFPSRLGAPPRGGRAAHPNTLSRVLRVPSLLARQFQAGAQARGKARRPVPGRSPLRISRRAVRLRALELPASGQYRYRYFGVPIPATNVQQYQLTGQHVSHLDGDGTLSSTGWCSWTPRRPAAVPAARHPLPRRA